MYDEPSFTVVLISGEAPRYKVLSTSAVLLSAFMAVRHLILFIDLPRVDARLIASCSPPSLHPHPISTPCIPMNQIEPVMSEEADGMTLTFEGEMTALKDNLLDEVEDAREALVSCPPDHPDRAARAAALGYHLYMRYDHTGDISFIVEAIEVQREVLVLRPPGHPHRANMCADLSSLLCMCYAQVGDVALLDEAIELDREALALRPPDDPDRADMCTNLGSSLRVRYKQTGDIALLDEAIRLEREAILLQPPGHPDRAHSCINLGSSLFARHQQIGDVALLDEAIDLEREALALRPPGHPDRASSCSSLGVSLHVRYKQTGDVMLLDEAIDVEREALVLRPPGHPYRAAICVGHAASLHARYELTGDVALLDEAINLEREALALRPLGHPDRASSCVNLGSSLYMRYQRTFDSIVLLEAIKLKREALALRSPGHPDRANICGSLALLLDVRYQQTGNVALLDEAIELEREALTLRPPGHPSRADSCANLGSSLQRCYEQTGDVVLLNEAIEVYMYASEHSSASRAWYPLAQLCELHMYRNSPHFSISKALEYLQQSFQHEVDNIYGFISNICHNAALMLDDFDTRAAHIPALLVDVYVKMVDRLPLVAGFVLDTSSRLQSLKSNRRIGCDACVAAMLAGQPATAVTLLDRAHGVVWTQALHQRDPQIEGAPKDLATELEDLLRVISTSTAVDPTQLPDDVQGLRHRKNTRIQAILREIRAMPGLARFMLGSTYETLREAAREHPVVVLVGGIRTFAVIVPSSTNANPDILPLDVAWNDLQSLADNAGKADLRYRAGATEHGHVETSGQEIPLAESTDQKRAMRDGNFGSEWSPLASLWRDVVKPVLTHLHLTVSHAQIVRAQCSHEPLQKEKNMGLRPRLHWCTAGRFAQIPVHAAGIYTGKDQECCSDYIVSSYTPTLSTLLRARKGLQPIRTTDAKILLVAAKHTANARLPPLGKVEMEMGDICSVVEKAGVQYAASSQRVSKTEEATAALPAANVVHIACHGLQNVSEPLESAFHLSDHDVLSVSDLMKLDLNGAYLAFLGACETAKGDRVQSDQAIHLAATMLFVGFKSVVATMW
jgi:tetratricopeptide (TPR) repeat protein